MFGIEDVRLYVEEEIGMTTIRHGKLVQVAHPLEKQLAEPWG